MEPKKRPARKLPNTCEQTYLDGINRVAMRLDLSCIFNQERSQHGELVLCDMWKSIPAEDGGAWQHFVRNLTSWEWERVDAHGYGEEVVPNILLWPLKNASDISMRYTLLRCVIDRICDHVKHMDGVSYGFDESPWKGALAERVFRKRLLGTCFSEDRARGATRAMTRFAWEALLPKHRSQLLVRIHGYSKGFGLLDVFRIAGHEHTAQAWKDAIPNAMPLLSTIPMMAWPAPEDAVRVVQASADNRGRAPWCTSRKQARRLLASPYTMIAEAVSVGVHGGALWSMGDAALERVGKLPVRLRAALVNHCSDWPRFKHDIRDKLMGLHLDYLFDRLEEMQGNKSKAFGMYYQYCAEFDPVIHLAGKICKTSYGKALLEGDQWEDAILGRLKGYYGAIEVNGHANLVRYMQARQTQRVAKALSQSTPLTTGQDPARTGPRRL